MAFATSGPSVPIRRERIVSIQRQQNPATCVLANQCKLVLSRFLARYVPIGDEITFPIPTAEAIGAEIFIAKPSPSGSMPAVYQVRIGYVTQPKPDKRNQPFVSAESAQERLASPRFFCPVRSCAITSTAVCNAMIKPQRTTFYDLLRIPMSASACRASGGFQTARSGPKPPALRAANRWPWSALSTSLASRNCAPRTMPSWPIPRPPRRFLTAALARFWSQASARAMDRRSSRVTSWRSLQSAGAGVSTRRYASVSFTTGWPSAATCAASLSCGSTLRSCIRFGSPPGISGNIC